MTIPIVCPGCAVTFDVPDELVGKTIRCADCGAKVKVTDQYEGVADTSAETIAETPKAKAKVAARDDDEDEKPVVKVAKKTGVVAAAFASAPKEPPTKKRRPADDDDDRPKPKKRKRENRDEDGEEKQSNIVIYGGGFLTLCSILGLILKIYAFGTKTNDTPSTGGGSSNTPVAAAGTEPGWQSASIGSEFSCQIPPGFSIGGNNAQMNSGGMKGFCYESSTKEAFFAAVLQPPEEIPPSMVPMVLDEAAKGAERGGSFGRRGNARVLSKTDITQDGFPGKDLQLATPNSDKVSSFIRIIVAGRNIVMYGAASDNYDAMRPRVQQFISSVKITGPSKSTPQVATNNPPKTGNPVATNDPPANPMGTTTGPPATPIVDPVPMNPMGTNTGPGPMPVVDPKQPGGGGNQAGKLAASLSTPCNAGAFDMEKKEFIAVGYRRAGSRQGGTIQRYSYPDFKPQGTPVNITSTATRAAIDSKKGLLYVTTMGASIDPLAIQFDRPAYIGDVAVYDLAQLRSGKFDEKTDFKPVATISIGATRNVIRDISLSSDGKTLFVMTTTLTGKSVSQVLRIDTVDRKTTKSVILPYPGWDMLPSPDGQKLYVTANMPAGIASPLMIVDSTAMTLVTPSFALAKPAYNLAVAKDGRIVASSLSAPITAVNVGGGAGGVGIGGPPNGGPPMGGIGGVGGAFGGPVAGPSVPPAEITVLDSTGAKVDAMRQANGGVSNNGYIAVSPDGKYFICSSQHPTIQGTGLDVYETSDKFIGDKLVASLKHATDGKAGAHLGGAFLISPDSEYVVLLNGAVLKLDDLTGNGGPAPVGLGGLTPSTSDTPPMKGANEEEAKAIALVQKLRGTVGPDFRLEDAPMGMVSLSGREVTDADLKVVVSLKNTTALFLGATDVSDLGVKELVALKRLTKLGLSSTKVTDAGMKDIGTMKALVDLDLGLTAVTDAGLKDLAGLTNLTNLNLLGSKVTAAGVAELKKALPKCAITK